MATQHPDHACAPPWKTNGEAFISAQEEVEECIAAFRDLKCQEYMWDWEGKYVDEAVVDKLFAKYYEYFQKKVLGKDVFLTFRLPNIWEEKGYRLARAYIGILTFEDLAHDLGFDRPPVFEVILPMTDAATKLLHLQKTFSQVAALKHQAFGDREKRFTYLRVIPLIEGVSHLTASRNILTEYLALHQDEYGAAPDYLRPFVARSDPSLNDGLVPATIAAKIALSEYYRFQDDTGIPVYPMIGVGCLPFRGGLSPRRIDAFLREYAGVRTVTIQSAFRYDYPLAEVTRGIATLNRALSKQQPARYEPDQVSRGSRLCVMFSAHYKSTVEQLADRINDLSRFIPQRRERMLHFGLFGYARGEGGIRLPRAIGFTAALYSIGVPPELIGTGRGLRDAGKDGLLKDLQAIYRNLRADLIEAGQYLNKENLQFLAKQDSAWAGIQEDVALIEAYLGEELGPRQAEHFLHRNFVSSAYLLWREGKEFSEYVLSAAKIRRSLG
ncbi:MAG: phosphoenolpyruvate carboxylase [Nitrospiria bacterium]